MRAYQEQGPDAVWFHALHTLVTGVALAHPVSRMWKGYWQRAQYA